MQRVAVWTAMMALLAVPAPGVTAPLATSSHAYDLAPSIMLRLFGETSDRSATLAASYGDRTSESPLRDLALAGVSWRAASRAAIAAPGERFVAVRAFPSAQAAPGPLDAGASDRAATLPVAHLGFDALPMASPGAAASSSPVTDFTVGRYQPVPEPTTIVAQPGSIAFEPTLSPAPQRSVGLAFGDANAPAGATTSDFTAPSVLRLGALHIGTRTQGASVTAPQQGLQDNAYGAGADFDVRAGDRPLNVDVSSNYERLTRNDSALAAPAVGASSWRLPDDGAPLIVPNYADVSKVSVGAAIAVPVVRGLTLKLDYGADRLFGGYGLPGLTNLDATDNGYGGKLTFQIPKTSSTLSFSASSLRYQDNIAPVNAFTQTRADVNFTVKF